MEQTTQATIGLLISAVAAAVTLGAAMWISRIFFKKDAVANFASAFSNAGFFGVPLITACISDGATFYVAAFIAFLNLLQWTYGVDLLTGGRGKLSIKKVITAPFMIAILIGLFFYFSGIVMPHILLRASTFWQDATRRSPCLPSASIWLRPVRRPCSKRKCSTAYPRFG